jgi:hypothetical protein
MPDPPTEPAMIENSIAINRNAQSFLQALPQSQTSQT